MLKTYSALAGAAMLLLTGGSAVAAGCHSGSFSGLYIGASVGYVGHDAEQKPLLDPKLSSDDGSAAGGLHIGYNVQCGHVVFGIETDINFLGTSVRTQEIDPVGFADFHSNIDWYGTLRGRLGVAVRDDLLIYATAGLAYADLTHNLTGVAPGPTAYLFSNSNLSTGWVVGGGAEFLRHERWVLRAEALYVDLGSENRDYTITGACGGTCYANVDWKDSFWTARVGLSYKLGGHTEHHESLK